MNKDVGNHIFLYIGNNFYVSIDFKKRLIRKEFHWLTIFFESMYAVVINSSMNFNNKGVCQKLWQCDQCVNEIAKKHMDFTPPPPKSNQMIGILNGICIIIIHFHYYNPCIPLYSSQFKTYATLTQALSWVSSIHFSCLRE